MQKVLILNGSPKAENGCTGIMLKALTKGMKKAGSDVEVLNLAKLTIKHCIGCMSCWLKTPGKCIHNDDMEMVIQKTLKADALIWATPLYHYHVTGIMKDAIDRTLPMALPWIIKDPQDPMRSTHPERWPQKNTAKKIALLSCCGFPEFSHFEQLLNWFRFYIKLTNSQNWGEILRPAGELLKNKEIPTIEEYLSILEKAGEEMITQEEISLKTKEELQMSLIPGGSENFIKLANAHFAELLGEEPPVL